MFLTVAVQVSEVSYCLVSSHREWEEVHERVRGLLTTPKAVRRLLCVSNDKLLSDMHGTLESLQTFSTEAVCKLSRESPAALCTYERQSPKKVRTQFS